MTIALVAVMMLIAIPAQAKWDDPYALTDSYKLVANAWEALGKGSTSRTNPSETGYQSAVHWAEICTYFWGPAAKRQHGVVGNLTDGQLETANTSCPWTIVSTIPNALEPILVNRWAIMDVGTAWFIMGEGNRAQGKNNTAGYAYDRLIPGSGKHKSELASVVTGAVDDVVPPTKIMFFWKVNDGAADRKAISYESDVYTTPEGDLRKTP